MHHKDARTYEQSNRSVTEDSMEYDNSDYSRIKQNHIRGHFSRKRKKISTTITMKSWLWWLTTLNPALGSLRPSDL